jgi:DNA repair protein RadA/Sms
MSVKEKYRCSKCQSVYGKWAGKCPSCNAWNTLESFDEVVSSSGSKGVGIKSSAQASTPAISARRVKDIATNKYKHVATGIGEFDRVLGGGLIPGGVILLAGDPGAGKSTILTTIAGKAADNGIRTLIISGEESVEQIALRAMRIGADAEELYIASEVDLSKVIGQIDEIQPNFLIIDSIQTIASPEINSRMGEKSQITEVATVMTRLAKERNIPLVMVGHVTKDGNIAGPRTIEHLVDVVLYFEGERDSSLRLLRGVKNRYGPSDEIGCFEHSESGILEVPDPSGLLLGRREEAVPGVVTAVSLEGRRPLPIEIQALVTGSYLPVPRKAVSGLDTPRSTMVQAIVDKHTTVRLFDKDVFLSTIGGIRTREPSVDLATALALASAEKGFVIPIGTVVIGEVTLSGEIRQVPGISRRLMEAERLGFVQAVIPEGSSSSMNFHKGSIQIVEVKKVTDAVDLFLTD